jgi:predicted AlkP superfamily phosphohydrolase/phosphomutase
MILALGRSTSIRYLLLAALAFLPLYASGATAAAAADGRVIVLGWDGADSTTTERMIAEGQLPNLERLAQQGTFAPLTSTHPAESAAGWAALNTGLNPAKNGIPSFFGRNIMGEQPFAYPFHFRTEDVAIEDFEHTGLMKILVGTDPIVLTSGTLFGVFLIFFMVFAGLLKVKKEIALVLAIALGCAGAWGANTASGYVPTSVPGVYKNNIEQDGFWAVAANAGVSTMVLDAALAFDRPTIEGARVLAGLGLPDARSEVGEWFIYTTDALEIGKEPKGSDTTSSSGTVFRVQDLGGKISSNVYGPVNFWEKDVLQRRIDEIEEKRQDLDLSWEENNDLLDEQDGLKEQAAEYSLASNKYDSHRTKVPLTIEKGLDGGKARVTISNQSQELAEGEWSDWYRLEFVINPLIKVHAVTRVKIMKMEDDFSLLINTLDIDPSNPPFWQPISQPHDFSADLSSWIREPYETLGWACMTNPIKDGEIDIDTFLEDIEFTLGWRRKLTFAALERDDWEVLFSVFSVTDRVQHIMYKYHDPGHPFYKESEASRVVTFFGEEVALKDIIPAIYRQMDKVVGEVMDKYVAADDTLLLCADHGFSSYRRGMHVNNWLAHNGFLKLKDGLKKRGTSRLDSVVDWSETKAYCLGLGMIFINQEGREPLGIVPPEEAAAVLAEIRDKFVGCVDAETGMVAGHEAVLIDDIYEGPYRDRCADMMLGFEEYFRVSWATAGGKLKLKKNAETGFYEIGDDYNDNSNNWSGDHASVAPGIVQGIFFSNRPVELPADGVSVLHLAPTVLETAGVAIPAAYDKPALKFR